MSEWKSNQNNGMQKQNAHLQIYLTRTMITKISVLESLRAGEFIWKLRLYTMATVFSCVALL